MTRLAQLSLLAVVAAASACGGRGGLKSDGAAGTRDAGAGAAGTGTAGMGAAGMGAAGTAGTGDGVDAGLDAAIEVSGPAPGPFMLTSPVGKPDETTTPVLTWEAPEGAVSFDVEISTSETFTAATTQRTTGLTQPTMTVPAPIAPAVVYFWRVTAIGPGGARTVATNAPAWFATPFTNTHGPDAIALTSTNKLLVVEAGTPVGLTILDLGTSKSRFVSTGGIDGRGLAVTADGKQAFVSEIAHYRVLQVDVENDVPATVLPSTIDEPIFGLAVTPDGSTLVAPYLDSDLGENVLALIPLRDGGTARSIRLGAHQMPYTVRLMPDGASALVNISGLSRVDLASGAITSIPDAFGDSLAVTGDGRTVWLTDYSDGVREVDLTTNTHGRTISFFAGDDQAGIAVSPDGRHAVVTSFQKIGVFDLVGGTIETTYPMSSRGVAVSPDGERAYVSVLSPHIQVVVLKL